MLKILLVDNNDSFTYNLVEILRQTRLCQIDTVLIAELNIRDIKKYDALVISPGPGLPEEKKELNRIIECCIQANKPILGICLGHQALVKYFGGKLVQLKRIIHGESSTIKVDGNEQVYKKLPVEMSVGRYHSWVADTESLPDTLKVTAITNDGLIMGVSHKNLNVRGLQYHPESILTPEGQKILTNWLENCI